MTPADLLAALKSASDIDLEVPGFLGQLEPHQRVAVTYALLVRRCLLVMAVGLGKTVISIALDQKLRTLGAAGRTLVVCQSGKRFDWQNEFLKFAGREVMVVDGDRTQRTERWLAGQRLGVTVASYEQVRIDLLEKQVLGDNQQSKIYLPSSLLRMLGYDLVVLDEVSIFKGWGTVLNLALGHLMACTQPAFCIGLSATPIQKSVDDVFTIIDKIAPGALGTKAWFDASFTVKRQVTGRVWRTVGLKNGQALQQLLHPLYLRREKHEVYPNRTVHRWKLRRVVMGSEQQTQYDSIVGGTPFDGDRKVLFGQFCKLEKVVDTMAHFGDTHESAKLDDLRTLLEGELAEEKVVIFSKHLLMLRECSEQVLTPLGWAHEFLTGEERDMRVRDAARHRFQNDPAVRAILVSTAAEMGFDLHAACYVVFLNHVYNPARTLQIIGRIDRPVVQKSSFICSIHYTTVGTFEEQIVPKLHREAELAKELLGQSNKLDGLQAELIDEMSRDNLLRLIKGGHHE